MIEVQRLSLADFLTWVMMLTLVLYSVLPQVAAILGSENKYAFS